MLQPPILRPGQVLRDLMKQGTVTMPGVFNPLSAIAAQKAGAGAIYLSGGAMTNAHLGVPDIALITQDEMAGVAARTCQVISIPILSDADTGFGETWNVARTVIEMERAGLAGIHIEDQVNPKRCGHLDGKELISSGDMEKKIRVAVDHKRDDSFLIFARTDARSVEGLDGAILRAQKYVEAGADGIFPEGLQSEAEFEKFRAAISVPLLANMTEFGKTPLIPVNRFSELGYEIVIFPVTALRVAVKAMQDWYQHVLTTGTQADYLDKMCTRQELYELIEYPTYTRRDQEWSDR